MKPAATVLVLVLALTPAVARAQTPDEPGVRLAPLSLPRADDNLDARSPGLAVGLAFTSTIVTFGLGAGLCYLNGGAGIALMGLGLGFGPAVGHAYAGEWGHFAITSLGRLALAGGGGALFTFGLVTSVVAGEDGGDSPAGTAMMVGGFVLGAGAVALAIYDIVDAAGAAKRHNAKHSAPRVAVAPMIAPSPAGGTRYGASLALTF